MQSRNLGWKFAFVGLLVLMCLYSIWAKELRQGIDLKGGHILTFEIQGREDDSGDLVQRVINRLKERIDPEGLYSLEWRKVGRNRFEVRMPLGTEEARQAKQRYLAAIAELQDENVERSELRRVITLSGQAREEAIRRICGDDAEREKALRKTTETHGAMTSAQRTWENARLKPDISPEELKEAENAYLDARAEHFEAVRELLASNINTEQLGQTLELYVPKAEERLLPKAEREERQKAFEKQLDQLRQQHPGRRTRIDQVVSAYIDWAEKRTGLDDPADLRRMIARAGVLEFRIAPTMPESRIEPNLQPEEYQTYLNQLAEQGPLASRSRSDPYQWFEMRGTGERFPTDIVIGKYAGKKYVLLSDQAGTVMLQDPRARAWSLQAHPANDSLGRPAVGFTLDSRGAKLMSELTSRNEGKLMAILLDDQVYSAPRIRETIYARGIIEGEFTTREVDELVRILDAGALEGRVNENPVSEKTIAPSIGEDNRKAGIRAAFWGLVGVAVFMMIYYLFAGAIADVALLLNIVLVLGAMSFIEAVFTLPGIAGVILTIGMAVDANVLIFERLREEQAKTQSMRMAIRNAYSNAASAILDGNATTLLTCLILGWVGTEEVRGFAITLGLGVMFSLFTALIVTRWIFQLLLEIGLIKNQVRMVAFIGTPNINWMAKRRIFWVVSILLVALGAASLTWQGKDLLGIEFSSGTQAVFSFKQGAKIADPDGKQILPERQYVESAIRNKATSIAAQARADGGKPQTAEQRAQALAKLAETAKVETLVTANKASRWLAKYDENADGQIEQAEWNAAKLPPDMFSSLDDGDGKLSRQELNDRLPERSFQVSTTVADLDLLREVVWETFGPALDMPSRVEFELQTEGPVPGLNITLDPEDKGLTYASTKLEQQVAPELRRKFTDFVGGAMFVIRDLSPALTEAQLAERIQTMRWQPDFADYQYNQTAVIGLEAEPEGEGFKSFAVIARNPNVDYVGRFEEWQEFAKNELNLLTEALRRAESLESTEFDPAVAGEAVQRAVFAFVVSWLAIVAYLWLRFGSVRWGLAAVVCLIHDVLISIGLVALSAYLAHTVLGRFLMIEPFKIDMAVVAAFLTIIGYSVNDTIVVFDRIRENRGKLTRVHEETINRSINQVLSRTLLTTTTTLVAVVVMYVWGGSGIHAFTYALLVGIIFGTYSSIAVASPLLLGFKRALVGKIGKGPQAVLAAK